MPGMIVHQLLVSRLLTETSSADGLPREVLDPNQRDALFLGSIAPDMGVFPGGDSFVSNLAHYIRTGTLCENLLLTADSETDRAFAWGWITHWLADILFHPLINRGVGELLHSNRDCQVSYAMHPAAHVGVEMGLDAETVGRFPKPRPVSLTEMEVTQRVDHLFRAYQATYGNIDVRNSLRRSLYALRRWSWSWILLARNDSNYVSKPRSIRRQLAFLPNFVGQALTLHLPSDSAVRGLFRARKPAEWLTSEFDRLVVDFVERMRRIVAKPSDPFPNLNLDTGQIDLTSDNYSLALSTEKQLEQMLPDSPHEKVVER